MVLELRHVEIVESIKMRHQESRKENYAEATLVDFLGAH